MKETPLKGLVIRTALVRRPDLGFIYACDARREEAAQAHTFVFKWKAGVFTRGQSNYNAHSVCLIQTPELGLVDISEPGYYSVETQKGVITGDIIQNSQPSPDSPRFGGIRSVSEIATKAYAVGYQGMVYRLDELRTWTRIDEGLSGNLKLEAIHGFDDSDLYAVGLHGELWHYNGNTWAKRDLPTNQNLNMVKCVQDGSVYIAGHGGILIRGTGETWKIIEQKQTKDHLWDVEWFNGQVYVSTMRNVFRLHEEELEPVAFGDDAPKSCYQLSSANGVMWSNGEFDIMSFDGQRWTRIV